MRPDQGQHQKHKSELPDLDTDVEEEQGSRQQAAFEAQSCQRACEADPVNQAEGECDGPGIAGGQPDFATLLFHNFNAHEHDTQRDAGVERPFRYADQPEGCGGERGAVSDGKGRDRLDQPPPAAHDPDQSQHE
jgi:hypothetical protein